ncbi:gastrula zinc finger protein XlCGF28.1-like [Silurus meridionalis]|nr:gastrula zinc finger protein XlCGF28.1-like [Silurus meridionalis]
MPYGGSWNPPDPVQSLHECTAPPQSLHEHAEPSQSLPESSALLQCVPESTSPLQCVQESSASPQDHLENSALPQDHRESSAPLQDLQKSSALSQSIPVSSALSQSILMSSSLSQSIPVSFSQSQSVPVSSSPSQRVPVSSSPFQRVPVSSSLLQRVPVSTFPLQSSPKSTIQLQSTLLSPKAVKGKSYRHPRAPQKATARLTVSLKATARLTVSLMVIRLLASAVGVAWPLNSAMSVTHLRTPPWASLGLWSLTGTSHGLRTPLWASFGLLSLLRTSLGLRSPPETPPNIRWRLRGHTGDKTALKTARAKLSRAIREAKRAHAHAKKIYDYFQDSEDIRRMWQGIQAITNYKTSSACDRDASLPDALNDFYALFEVQNNVKAKKTTPSPTDQVLCLTTAEVRKTLCRVNPRKSAGPDNFPGRVLRECAEQPADVFTDIFNIFLSSNVVPTCLKTTTVVPVPKKSTVSCLNDYCPVTLTPIVMKCFERLVMRHIKTQLPPSLDPMQFAYRPKCSTDDAISTTLNLALTHLDNKDSYVRMLFIDFSSAFNTIINQHLIEKLNLLGLNTSFCNWILDILTGRPHKQPAQSDQSPLNIDGCSVEIVKSTKFLVVHLADNITWSLNTSSITKKAQQRLYFLRSLRKAHLPPPILTMFYRGTIESILSSCITAWSGNCTVSDRKTLQRILRTAEKIIGVSLPSIMHIYTTCCICKANSIVDDHTPVTHTFHSPAIRCSSEFSSVCGGAG